MLMTATQPRPKMARLTVMQGQVRVSDSARVELTTVLGSCIATCLFDAQAGVGGMNHFLLGEPQASQASAAVDEHYGVYLMEVLINEMLAYGATRSGLRARIYGGANMHSGMARIGTANAQFAKVFLERERIALVHADLGGVHARRVDFRPASGQSRCRVVAESVAPAHLPTPRHDVSSGDVELF